VRGDGDDQDVTSAFRVVDREWKSFERQSPQFAGTYNRKSTGRFADAV